MDITAPALPNRGAAWSEPAALEGVRTSASVARKGTSIQAARPRNAPEKLYRWIMLRVRLGATKPPTPTAALITPMARPRWRENHGAISMDVGTSETAAVPIPSTTQYR